MSSHGIVFAATGERYVSLARRAARTVRNHMPDVQIDLFTGPTAPNDPVFSQITLLETVHRRPKMEALRRSRFEHTLYLDADVVMVAPVDELFELLPQFDLIGAHEQFGSSPIAMTRTARDVPVAFRQINSGVLGITKSPRTQAFLEDWETRFRTQKAMFDQPILRETLFDSDLRFWVLPSEYNQMYPPYVRFANALHMAPRLLHLTQLHENAHHATTPEAAYDIRQLLSEPAFANLERLMASDRTLGNPPQLRHAAGETLRKVPSAYRAARWTERVWRAMQGR